MSEQRYKTITLYFDIKNPENMALYSYIADNAQANKKSSFVIASLQTLLRKKPTSVISDQMCAEIAKRIADELRPQLVLTPVSAETSLEQELIAEMDMDLGCCEF